MAIKLISPRLTARIAQGSVSALGSTIEWSEDQWGLQDLLEGGTLSVTLEINEGPEDRRYAPHLAIVEPIVSGYFGEELSIESWDATGQMVTFVHDWGDEGARFTVAERIDDAHRDRNTSSGHVAQHVYRKAGSYNYFVLAFDQKGNYGIASAAITAKEDDFNDYETVVIAGDGDFTGCPYTANRFTSLEDLNSWTGGGAGQKCLVYIKRGYEYPSLSTLKQRDYFFRSWGAGYDPKITFKRDGYLIQNYASPALRFSQIHFVGLWDAVNDIPTDRTIDPSARWGVMQILGGLVDIILDQCTDEGMILSHEVKADGRFCLHECKRTNWRDFSFLGNGRELHFSQIGCSEIQYEDAANGGMSRDMFAFPDITSQYLRNSHNGCRVAYAKTVVFNNNDLFRKHGWTLQNYLVFDNPQIRVNTSIPDSPIKTKLVISKNFIEGEISNGEASGHGVGMMPIAALVEQNTFVSTPTGGAIIGADSCGWRIENNIFIKPEFPSVPGVPERLDFVIFNLNKSNSNGNVTHPDNFLTPNIVQNNSFVNLDQNVVPNLVTHEGHSETKVENSVSYFPNNPTPIVSDGPLDLTTTGKRAYYKGIKRGYEFWQRYHALVADVPDGGTVLLPYGPDWYGNTTKAADFAGQWNRHSIDLTDPVKNPTGWSPNDSVSRASPIIAKNCTFSFESGGIRVTNLTGATWTAGWEVSLMVDRGDAMMAMDTRYAAAGGTVAKYGISTESGAYQTATPGSVSRVDFHGRIRPGTEFHEAPIGTSSRGALEPV